MKDAETIAGEAIQVIGSIADEGGLWHHPKVQAALDYFSEGWRMDGAEILPFVLDGPVMPVIGRDGGDDAYPKPDALLSVQRERGE